MRARTEPGPDRPSTGTSGNGTSTKAAPPQSGCERPSTGGDRFPPPGERPPRLSVICRREDTWVLPLLAWIFRYPLPLSSHALHLTTDLHLKGMFAAEQRLAAPAASGTARATPVPIGSGSDAGHDPYVGARPRRGDVIAAFAQGGHRVLRLDRRRPSARRARISARPLTFTSAKHGVIGLTKTVALEGRPRRAAPT
jgi:hypothetical protein